MLLVEKRFSDKYYFNIKSIDFDFEYIFDEIFEYNKDIETSQDITNLVIDFIKDECKNVIDPSIELNIEKDFNSKELFIVVTVVKSFWNSSETSYKI